MEIDGGNLRIAPSPMNEYDWPAVEQSGAPAPGDRDLEPADIARLTFYILWRHDERDQHRGRREARHGYEVNCGMIVVSGGILGSKPAPLSGSRCGMGYW
jgi:hypothetical protein